MAGAVPQDRGRSRVAVEVAVEVAVGVAVEVGVEVGVEVAVGVGVGVEVGVEVAVEVAVEGAVAVEVAVAVADAQEPRSSMPELPEVEIAARNLRAWTAGRRIVRVEPDPRARYVFRPAGPARFARAVEGARFGGIRRIGKQLLLTLEKDGAPVGLLAHLGMTGKWLRRGAGDPPPRFSRARFALDDGAVLHFEDMRLFGRLRVVPGARFERVPEIAALVPDPLEAGIDPAALAEALARSRLPVKVRIMDQAILPGVGNIQASEALFRARVDPRRRSSSLAAREVKAVADAVLASVRESIAREEGPEISYVEEPGAENPFLVYAREGERCPRCRREAIRRVVQAQRSTFFCPRCQR